MNSYTMSIKAGVSSAEAFEGICNVRGWWATNVSGYTKKSGDSFTVRFGKTFSVMKISTAEEDKKFRWNIEQCYLPLFVDPLQWQGTAVEWIITPVEKGCNIRMTHIGLTPDRECYEDCRKGWTFYVGESLRQLIETGKGMPGTGIFARIMMETLHEGLLYYKSDPVPVYDDGYIFIDVQSTQGETITAHHSIGEYDCKTFDPGKLRGEYFMVLKKFL